jgi:hypothetical protein
MKKMFGACNPEEVRRQDAPIKNITSCNVLVDSGTRMARQEAHFRLPDLTRLNELFLASNFDWPKGNWPWSAWENVSA